MAGTAVGRDLVREEKGVVGEAIELGISEEISVVDEVVLGVVGGN